MKIKTIMQAIKMKLLILLLASPISLGAIEAFYKFDIINIPLLFYVSIILFLGGIGLNSLHILSINKQNHNDEQLFNCEYTEQISINIMRLLGYGGIVLSSIMTIILASMTTMNILYLYLVLLIIFLLYLIGYKSLWKTSLNEVIFSFGIGYLLSAFVTYTQVYMEVTNVFSFYVFMLWVSFPIVLSLACIQFVYNQKFITIQTMTHLMGQKLTFIVMEVSTLLSCLIPCISTYLNDSPWTVVFIWLMYPKMIINLKKYESVKQNDLKLYYIKENAIIVVSFLLLLTIFGVFF